MADFFAVDFVAVRVAADFFADLLVADFFAVDFLTAGFFATDRCEVVPEALGVAVGGTAATGE